MPKLKLVQSVAREAPHGLTLKKSHLAAVILILPLVLYTSKSSGADRASGSVEPLDITNKEFEQRSANCAAYLGGRTSVEYTSSVRDMQRGCKFKGWLRITQEKGRGTCVFQSNSIPNHDFNDGSTAFANKVSEVDETYEVPATPKAAPKTTPLSTEYDNGILLNGVKLDLLSAACYGVGDEPLGEEKIGCLTMRWGWRYDPMSPKNSFGADTHNAHAQPDGAYHYHGNPHALFKQCEPPTLCDKESPVIGFAADGFPIYGSFIKGKDGKIHKVRSGYTLKSGARQKIANERCGTPSGDYDGRFNEDYEFTNAGDLDECNGMVHNGSYGYYVTDTYPWVLGCFKGTPDPSFKKEASSPAHKH